ncbi:MAG: rhomboid family intramembrane serine protease [Cytophagaceae bacterium]
MKKERDKLIKYTFPGLIFIIVASLVYILDTHTSFSFYKLGIFPRDLKGLIGILTSPLIHKDSGHLLSNAIPIVVLATGIRLFYYEVAYKIYLYIYLISGIWLWCFAREAYHIGASGILYGFATFLFLGGILRKDRSSIAVSLLVTFLYGSLIWGIFPFNIHISWEAHLLGGLAGILVAFHFKKYKIPTTEPEYEWMKEDDNKEDENPYWKVEENEPEETSAQADKEKKEDNKPELRSENPGNDTQYRYVYIPKNSDNPKNKTSK